MRTLFEQARSLINTNTIERYFAAPGSKWVKGEYWTLSPLRDDKNIKSGTFSINAEGLWKDMATGEGGDFIDLICAKYNCSKKEAAEKIVRDCTGSDYIEESTKGHSGRQKQAKHTKEEHKKPVKKNAVIIPETPEIKELLIKKVQSSFNLEQYGKPAKIYTYKNIDQQIIMYVCRYERQAESGIAKNTIPYYYDGERFNVGRPENLKIPLFNEDQLTDKEKPVLIVEGEKCAKIAVEGYIVVSWIGGTGNVQKADFSLLKGRKIIIWPDNDEAGRKAGLYLKDLLETDSAVEMLEIKEKPDKWDIADAHDEGLDIVDFIDKCPRHNSLLPETPYDAFIKAITEIYGIDNLDQYEGYYYVYNEGKHYWTMRLQCTIEADLQTWITKNLKMYLDQEEKAIHTFISNVKSFVKSYQRTFFEVNPFKNTAISPYIHVKNGAIEITEDGFLFHKRSEKTENFYRELYPMNCLDVDFDMKYYEEDNMQKNAPMFYKYVCDMIPDGIAKNNKAEEMMTFDMFSQIIGYTLNPIKRKPYFFAFYGKQESGKSFFIDILKTIIPTDFFTETPVKNMDNKFASSSLFGSKIYVDDDFKAGASLPDDFIKAYSGKKTISIEYKNQNTIKGVAISVAMFFLSNHVFTVQGGPEGIERRFVFLPFRKSIKKPDIYMLDKMTGLMKKNADGEKFDERAAILGFALRGIKLMQENNFDFVMPKWVQLERAEWLQNSSSITQFLFEEIYDTRKGEIFSPQALYEDYKSWCAKNDKKAYGRNSFYESLKQDEKIDFYHDVYGNHFKIK